MLHCARYLAPLLLLAAASRGLASDSGQLSSWRSQYVGISLERSSGSIAEFRDLATGYNFVEPGAGCWELQIVSNGETSTVLPSQAGTVDAEDLEGGRRFVWREFPRPLPPGLRVEVTVSLQNTGSFSSWRMAVEGLPRRQLRQARFPVVHWVSAQPGECLAVPQWMGQLAREPRRLLTTGTEQGRRWEWHYPGELSLQCMALWGARGGLSVSCRDNGAFRKGFAVVGDGRGRLGCEVIHLPEQPDGDSSMRWTLPYEVELGTFRGDWFAAAEHYRSWGTNQPWARESRLARGAVPDWLPNAALWVWNRGRSEGVLGPAVKLEEELGLPVSVFWHWWHGCAYDTGFPEYLPPREGAAPFKAAVADARQKGVNALVYMNQRLWGMRTSSWTNEDAPKWAVKGQDGKIHPEVYNTFTKAPCAAMCLGTDFWRNKYASLAEQAVSGLGVSGIYMDQACLSLSCYDPEHGHPVGGGSYWVDGFRRLTADIRARCAASGQVRPAGARTEPALAGEGCGEPWLSELDLMLSLQVSRERYAAPDGWETIPFFHAVYHPWAILFGNYSSLTMPPYDELWPSEFAPKDPLQLLDRKFSTQFCLEQARSFVWGQQPTIANFTPGQLQTRRREIDFVLRLAKVRQRSMKYLLRGTMLRPPKMHAGEQVIPMSRLSIYAGQQGGLRTFEKKVPLVLGAAWRAPDGQVALVLANISEELQQFRVTIPATEYGLSEAGKIVRSGDRDRARIGKITLPNTDLELRMPAQDVWVLEFGS